MNRNQFQLVVALTLTASAPTFSSQNNSQELKRSLETFSTTSPKKAKPDAHQAAEDLDEIVIQVSPESPKTKKHARKNSRESLTTSKDGSPTPPTKQSKTEPDLALPLSKSQLIDKFLSGIQAEKLWSKSDAKSVKKLLNKAPDARISFILDTLATLTKDNRRADEQKQSAKDHKSIIRKLTRLKENLLEDVKTVTKEFMRSDEIGGTTTYIDTLDILMETAEEDFPTAVQVMSILAPSTGFNPYIPFEEIIGLLSNLQNYQSEIVLNNYILFVSGGSWKGEKEDLLDLLRAMMRIKNMNRLSTICLLTSDINQNGSSRAISHLQILEALTKLDQPKIAIVQECMELIQRTPDAKSIIEALYFIPYDQAHYFLNEVATPAVMQPNLNQAFAAQPHDAYEYEEDGYAADDYHPQGGQEIHEDGQDEEIEGDYNYDAYAHYSDDDDDDDQQEYPYEDIQIHINYNNYNRFQVMHSLNQMLVRHAINILYDEGDGANQLYAHWRQILEGEDREAASELIDLITGNFRRLGLTEVHPLVELAQTVDTFIQSNDRSSPYYIYAQMRLKKERTLEWSAVPPQVCMFQGNQLIFRPKNLCSFCSNLAPDYSLAPNVTVDKFIHMLIALKTRLANPNFAANFANVQLLHNIIARNLTQESHLQTLLRAPAEDGMPAKLKCILKNYLNIIVTDIRLNLFANFLLSVQNCSVGQDTAIDEIYYSLPPKARLQSQAEDVWSKDKSRKALQILGQAFQRISMEHFSEGSTFVRLACGLGPTAEIRQAAHQVQALRGLIGNYVGLPSELKFDMNSPLLYEPILQASCDDLVKLFYQNNKLDTMLPALKRTINEEIISLLPRDNEIYAHFMNIFGDETEDHIIMAYKDDEDLIGKFQGLNDKGVIGLLKHFNILEDVE